MGGIARALMACLAAAMAFAALAADKPTTYGKKLLLSQDLTAEAVAKFVRFNAAQAAKGAKPGPFPDTEDWIGEPMAAPSSGNPYTLVVHVSGKAIADGEASTGWLGGWAADGGTTHKLITGTSRAGVKAGEPVVLVGASAPLSFKEDRTLAPALGFMHARNLQIDGVRLEVWSGIGKSTLPQLVFAWSPLLVGLAFLGLFFWFRRKA
jgi:hypothetical protein